MLHVANISERPPAIAAQRMRAMKPFLSLLHDISFFPILEIDGSFLYISHSGPETETVILVANTQAMNAGVDLHRPCHVGVYLERHWNVIVVDQTFDQIPTCTEARRPLLLLKSLPLPHQSTTTTKVVSSTASI